MQYQCPEPGGSTIITSREIDTHRVMLQKIRDVPQVKISSPDDVKKFMSEMADFDRERIKILHLDTKNRVVGVETVAVGGLDSALVHPREVIKGSLLNNAAGIIFVHNHPSGLSQPSNEDDRITSRLRDAFNIMGIDVVDSIIVSKEGKGYYSYKEAGRLPGKGTGTGDRIMEEKDDKCSIALRAAMSTIKDYCPEEGVTEVDIGGVIVKVTPDETVMRVREDPGLTDEQKVKAIQESVMAQDQAKHLCTRLFGTVPGTDEYDKCIERVSRNFAENLMAIEMDVRRIRKEKREERISSEKTWG